MAPEQQETKEEDSQQSQLLRLASLLAQSQERMDEARTSGKRLHTVLVKLQSEIAATKAEMDKAKAEVAKTQAAIDAARKRSEGRSELKDSTSERRKAKIQTPGDQSV